MEKKLNLSKHKKRYCFDLDGVLCKTKSNFYKNSTPIKSAIKLVNKLYEKGNYILIYTSRYMGRSKDNPTLAKKRGYKLTYNQLKKWNVKYNKLLMGKPSYDLLIDDKSIGFTSKWYNKIKI
tara:strand:+ start:851 stop:1216 length:366 start_codon:yes stop_codon:yes gene_type:complete